MNRHSSLMLHDFLTVNRADLIDRCRAKVALRPAPKASPGELEYGVPLFLDQLVKTLRLEHVSDLAGGRRVSGPSGGGISQLSEIGEAAARHGGELLKEGFTVDQVVHDYGDLCQAIMELASTKDEPIDANEFRILNRCLDNAIADAVTEYSYQRDSMASERQANAFNEQLGFLAHELRNSLNSAALALTAIKTGNVGITGATGAILERSLSKMRKLIDSSLAEVRMKAKLPAEFELISVADLIAELKISGSLEAQTRKLGFSVSTVKPMLAVDADRDLLLAAIGNLLQNAFKFTRPHTEVFLNAYAAADRILIDVEDKCGGLPRGSVEKLFSPFQQSSPNKSGVGLGLSIARRGVEANNGTLSVRDIPGQGCVFTIDLPRHSLPAAPQPAGTSGTERSRA